MEINNTKINIEESLNSIQNDILGITSSIPDNSVSILSSVTFDQGISYIKDLIDIALQNINFDFIINLILGYLF